MGTNRRKNQPRKISVLRAPVAAAHPPKWKAVETHRSLHAAGTSPDAAPRPTDINVSDKENQAGIEAARAASRDRAMAERILNVNSICGGRAQEYHIGMMLRATVLITTMLTFLGFGKNLHALEVGAPAPQITAIDQDGKSVSFPDVYAKGTTLVFFYPKAETPGCTAQACSLRDSFDVLRGKNLEILGVSRDTAEAQKKFQSKFQLPFTLIADHDGKVAEAFGVPGMMGLPVSSRQSFLVKDGKIVWIAQKAKTKDHAAEVQAAIDSLQ